ncbi:MAG: 2-oxo acid dehydrogenase subunit E2 [Oleispira sp.]|nr:2-oxo acid dehydrogenase subunit E2 [Oleispira sp.]MBL4881165.1 2-oxo acid dehydrogenase subunit E2 [Oleispira sp.]
MRYFKLPDLGEGLIEAEIVEWHVKAGDSVNTDQLMLAVETAKAIVEIPSPQMGIIEHTFGDIGDTVHIGEPLVEYQGESESVSVVGDLSAKSLHASTPKEISSAQSQSMQPSSVKRDSFSVGTASRDGGSHRAGAKQASPSVRGLASRLDVDIEQVIGSGEGGRISSDDVEKAARLNQQVGKSEKLTGVRKSMAKVMINSHQQVVPVTLFGDAILKDTLVNNPSDITIVIAQAIAFACNKEPALNCWFDGDNMSRRLLDFVDLGIAVDTEQGLFVPVLRQVQQRTEEDLKEGLQALKQAVIKRNIPPSEMTGASIILSNYGSIKTLSKDGESRANPCLYGTPIVVPPMVAIIGIGTICGDGMNGEKKLPISLTFDHRCVTGGEATRFMGYLVEFLL